MGTKTPKALQNAVFYTVGKIRGGVEMRQIKISQIKRFSDPDRYVYTELVSKTNNGTFKSYMSQSKLFLCFKKKKIKFSSQTTVSTEAGERCPVQILDLYYSKLSKKAFENDIFPLENVPADSTKPWYSCTPVGKNTLEENVLVCRY